MQSYHLTDEFTDIPAEQGLLASLAQSPTLYWDLVDLLTPEVFAHEILTWKAIALASESDRPPLTSIPADWLPAPDPHAAAHYLVALHQRRLLAAVQERLAQALFDETTPTTDLVTLLEEEVLRVQVSLRSNTAGRLQWASTLLPQVLADAEARRLQREATGSAVLGVPTGLAQLDNLLGRLQWASTLLPQVLADAEARRLQREATGSAVLGVPTGLAQLDNLLGGLNEGLCLLAGP